jgi:Leucine-rich repeat (LRR) protein
VTTTTRTVSRDKTEKVDSKDTSRSKVQTSEVETETTTSKTSGGFTQRDYWARYEIRLIDAKTDNTAWIATKTIKGEGLFDAAFDIVEKLVDEGLLFDPRDTITSLSLSSRELRSDFIPAYVFSHNKLKRLSFSGMACDPQIFRFEDTCWSLREIPWAMTRLDSLEELRLRNNTIREVPEWLSRLKKLRVLDLSGNYKLKGLINLTRLTTLEELHLNDCQITGIPDEFARLSKLKKLVIGKSGLTADERQRLVELLPSCIITF